MTPFNELRAAYRTVLEGNVTYTRRGGPAVAPYFDRIPAHTQIYPYLRYENAIFTPRNSRGCNSWDAIVFFEIVTGFSSPDHAKRDWADELEEQVINLITASSLTLAGFISNTPDFEESHYNDEEIFASRAADAKVKYYVIRKLTQFRHSIQQA